MIGLQINVPVAFSVRDYHEFQAHRDVLFRLNPQFRISEIATGIHIHGGPTCYWGLVHLEGQKVDAGIIHEALHTAGFDFKHNGSNLKVVV